MKTNMNNYIGDELAHKVHILSKALYEAQQINILVEQENNRLKDILTGLMSLNKEDFDSYKEDLNDRFCTI